MGQPGKLVSTLIQTCVPLCGRGRQVAQALTLACALCWGTLNAVSAAVPSEVGWETLASGLAVTLWNPAEVCPDVPGLVMLRIDPERFRFSVHQYREVGVPVPLTIQEWQRRTDAYVVFNAGLFREDYSYLGLLYKEGRPLGGRRHHTWQGLFVAEPADRSLRKARVLDLAFDQFPEEAPPYREAAQSLMLLDRTGKLRVKDSGKRAYQTVVGESGEGAILVIKSVAAVSLHQLADCLRNQFPSIRQAMAMDGGSSSDVMASPDLLHAVKESRGQTEWRTLLSGTNGVHIGLPAVISITPRMTGRATTAGSMR
ncbi:MAG TPA: phosphodiester glycosidase family protein [Nitrospiraceae bacterium]|nr:phosphodiester glycosidase family protein [Nitrospiraceae bacterium]